jgi:hypothetical protein
MTVCSWALCDVLLNQFAFVSGDYNGLLWFQTTQASEYKINQGTIPGRRDGLWVITTESLT